MHEQWKLTTGEAFPLTLQHRWPAAVQRSRRSDRQQAGSRSDAEQFLAHRPISKGEGDDGLYARPALPVQPRSDRTAIAGIGALRGQGQAIRRGQRRRFLGPSRSQGGRCGVTPFLVPAKPDKLFDQKGTGFLVKFQRTPRDQCACRAGLRRRHPGQSVRRGARQTPSGVERRDQRSCPFAGHGFVQGYRQNQGQGDPVRRQRGGDRLSPPWIARHPISR